MGENTLNTDDLLLPVMILIGLFGGVLTLMALETYYGWETMSTAIAPIIAAIAIFAIVVVAIMRYAK